MLQILKGGAIFTGLILLALMVWVVSSENRQTTAIQVLDRIVTGKDNSTFIFKSNGDVEVYTQDCEDPWIGEYHQHAKANTRTTVIEGVNHKVDDVERVSSQFLRINGKLYDAYVAEFQRMGINKTNNIENDIKEATFQVTDEEEQYFTDGDKYFFTGGAFSRYPTFRACFSSSDKSTSLPTLPGQPAESDVDLKPIILSEFTLDSPEEASLYLSQDNNLFLDEEVGGYTPYAALNNKLYFQQPTGKFTEVVNASPSSFDELMDNYSSYSSLYTDGEYIIFQGKIIDLDLNTFEAVKVVPQHLGYAVPTGFFKANEEVYYLTKDRLGTLEENSKLLLVGADADSFEVVDTNGSASGRIYQDKNFIYSFDKNTNTFITQPR